MRSKYNILSLDISMWNSQAMHILDSLDNFNSDLFFDWTWHFITMPADEIMQSFSFGN